MQNQASRAARARLDEQADGAPEEVVDRLRRLTEDRANAVWERLGGGGETPSRAYVRLRREMLEAEREVFRDGPRRGPHPGGGAGPGAAPDGPGRVVPRTE